MDTRYSRIPDNHIIYCTNLTTVVIEHWKKCPLFLLICHLLYLLNELHDEFIHHSCHVFICDFTQKCVQSILAGCQIYQHGGDVLETVSCHSISSVKNGIEWFSFDVGEVQPLLDIFIYLTNNCSARTTYTCAINNTGVKLGTHA